MSCRLLRQILKYQKNLIFCKDTTPVLPSFPALLLFLMRKGLPLRRLIFTNKLVVMNVKQNGRPVCPKFAGIYADRVLAPVMPCGTGHRRHNHND